MNELAVSPNAQPIEDVNFQNATVLRGYAGQFRPEQSENIRQFDKSDKLDNPEGNL